MTQFELGSWSEALTVIAPHNEFMEVGVLTLNGANYLVARIYMNYQVGEKPTNSCRSLIRIVEVIMEKTLGMILTPEQLGCYPDDTLNVFYTWDELGDYKYRATPEGNWELVEIIPF